MSETATAVIEAEVKTGAAAPVPLGQLDSVEEFVKRRGEAFEPVEDKPVEAKPATETVKPAETEVEPDPASEAGKELAKKRNSLQSRIDEVTRKSAERERELLAKIAALEVVKPEAKPDTNGNAKPAEGAAEYKRIMSLPGAPKVSEFETYEEFLFAGSHFVSRTLANEDRDRERGESQTRSAAEAQTRAYETAKAAHADIDTVMTSFVEAGGFFSPASQNVILNHKLGSEVAYFLAKNPERNAAIVALRHPGLEMIEIGKVIGELEAAAKAGKPAETAPVKKVSNAPEPVKPIEGETSVSNPDPSTISSVATWQKERKRFL